MTAIQSVCERSREMPEELEPNEHSPVQTQGAGLLVVEAAGRSQPCIAPVARLAFPRKALLATKSSREAIEALQRFPCDLVLVDLQLPDGSGIEILELAARLQPQAQCIVATELEDDDHIFASLAAGAKGYLLKSQPQQTLLAQLRQLSDGVPALSATVTRRILEHFSRAPTEEPRHHSQGSSTVLSLREREVLRLLAHGRRTTAVASELHISTHTVCSHVKNIYRKLGVTSRAQAALLAQQIGLI